MDLKIRFTLFFAALSLCLLWGFSAFVYFQVKDRMMVNAATTLAEHLEHEAIHLPDGKQEEKMAAHPPHKAALFLKVWKGDKLIESSFPADFVPIEHEGLQQQLSTVSNGDYYRLEGFLDLSETQRYLTALRRVLIAATVFCALIIVPFGYVLTRFLLAPFRQLADSAGGLTAKQLSFRFSEKGAPDEFGSLKRSFNELLSRLEKSFSQVERFATQASHELRTPIAVLRSHIDVALRRKRTMKKHETTLRKLLLQTERLDGVTQRLLALSDIERTAQAPGTEVPLLIKPTLEEVCQAVTTAHPERDTDIQILQIPSDLQWKVSPTYFTMLIQNLLDNAVKHAKQTVTVEAAREDKGLTIRIGDDGPGIPEAERSHIFEPFYRIASTQSGAPKGHGLGLAIAKACAEACSATLQVGTSQLGGAEFSVSLPT